MAGFPTVSGQMRGECNVTVLSKWMVMAALLVGSTAAVAQQADFNNWPAGTSPQEVGKKLAEHFVTSPHQYTATIHYSEAAAWYGALNFATLTHDDALRAELIKRFDPLLPGGAEFARIPKRPHRDRYRDQRPELHC
jgi:hypothetical protein